MYTRGGTEGSVQEGIDHIERGCNMQGDTNRGRGGAEGSLQQGGEERERGGAEESIQQGDTERGRGGAEGSVNRVVQREEGVEQRERAIRCREEG